MHAFEFSKTGKVNYKTKEHIKKSTEVLGDQVPSKFYTM